MHCVADVPTNGLSWIVFIRLWLPGIVGVPGATPMVISCGRFVSVSSDVMGILYLWPQCTSSKQAFSSNWLRG